jgi:hypothetical protein
LEVLSEPLRKLIAKQGLLGSRLLRDAVASAGEDGGGEHQERARLFVDQVLRLRGARKTVEMVREFWIGGRGAAFAYAG